MNSVHNNGQQRKTLAAQIDRLDSMLDGLGENLNDAVAQAVKDAVALAVQEAARAVLTEVLTDPVLQAKLRAATEAAKEPSSEDVPPPSGIKQQFASCWNWLRNKAKKTGEQCSRCYRFVRSMTSALSRRAMQVVTKTLGWARWQLLRTVCGSRFIFNFATAVGIGFTFRSAAFFAGYFLSASTSELKEFVVALAVRVWFWLRDVWGMFGMSGSDGSTACG